MGRAVILGEPRNFCCAGCLAVAETIVESGLENYYLDRDTPASGPAALPEKLTALLAFDHPAAQKEFLRQEDGTASCELTLENISCAACAWLIERRLQQQQGVQEAVVNLSTHRLHLRWDNEVLPLSQLLILLEEIGYRARPYRADAHVAQLKKESRNLLLRLAVAGFGMMQVMMYAGSIYVGTYSGMEREYHDYLNWTNFVITTPVFFYSGWPFYRSAWRALRARRLNMDVSVSLALAGAYFASVFATIAGVGDTYFDSVTMFIFFLLTSHFLEARARQRAGDTAASLMALTPRLATRLDDHDEETVIAAVDLLPGDRVLVRPGETVPADGTVAEGKSAVSEALLTGEPLPLPKHAGDPVVGGSLNTDGSLLITVSRTTGDSILGTLNRLLNRALGEKPLLARRADELAQVFVAVVLLIAAIVFAAWTWIDGGQHAFWITLAVLVATCPCALSLATPVALSSATNALAERGFLLTRGHVLETLAAATHVIFDKTGTLTTGQLQLVETVVLRGEMTEALDIVCALESRSEHPVAHAFRSLNRQNLPRVAELRHEAGGGVSGEIGRHYYRFGHAAFALGKETDTDNEKLWLADKEGAIAAFTLSDSLRPEAASVISGLKTRGLETWLLSGDRSPVVQDIGKKLGMARVEGSLSPEDKQARVKLLQEHGAVVVMVGDGVNDAPVLAQAHLSIAMASATDLAQVTADAMLLRDDLRHIVTARDSARKTRRIIRQNLGWSLAYNLAVLPPAALGWLPPWLAALGMSLSSLVVVLNALRLRHDTVVPAQAHTTSVTPPPHGPRPTPG